MKPVYTYLHAMSFTSSLLMMSGTAFPFTHVLLALVQLTLLGGVLMVFRPLLTGLVRALVTVVRPRAARTAKTHS